MKVRRELLDEWPDDFPKPAELTLWKWLTRAVALGLAKRDGAGAKNDPFRCWLPMMEPKWQSDPQHLFYQSDREAQRLFAEMGMPGTAGRKRR